MNTNIDTLLDDELNNGETTLTVDEQTRAIKYEGSLLLGIEDDYQADRIYFRIPKIVGDNIDVSAETAQIYVDFKNAYNEPYIIECTDKALQEDGTVKFSWLLTEKVTAAKGKVEFRVCVKNYVDGLLHNEWHSAIFVGEVLKGIDVSSKTPEILVDTTASTYLLIQKISEWEAKLDETYANIAGYTKDEVDTKIEEINNDINAQTAELDQRIDNADEKLKNMVDLDSPQVIAGYKIFDLIKARRINLEGGTADNPNVIFCDGVIETSKGFYITDFGNDYIVLAGGGVKQLPVSTTLFSGSTAIYDPLEEDHLTQDSIKTVSFTYTETTKLGDKIRVYFNGGINYPTCQAGVIECELVSAGTAMSGRGCFTSYLGDHQPLLIGVEVTVTYAQNITLYVNVHALGMATSNDDKACVYMTKVELLS